MTALNTHPSSSTAGWRRPLLIVLLVVPGLVAFSAMSDNTLDTFAGTGSAGYSGDGGQAKSAKINKAQGLAVDYNGNVYIADTDNNVIRKVTASNGVITTFAGTGTEGSSGDGGLATIARFRKPRAVVAASDGTLYIADTDNHKIRAVAPNGIISTVAGTGAKGATGDGGAATSATFDKPRALAIASNGQIIVADTDNSRIRKFTVGGNITNVAGTTEGYGGDGGLATAAKLRKAEGVAVGPHDNNIYIADTDNHRIRKVDVATGVITTIAGTGSAGYSGDGGLATAAQLNKPVDVLLDQRGHIYIAEKESNSIRVINRYTGVIRTLAGTGAKKGGYSGDGSDGTLAKLNKPNGVGFRPNDVGFLYFCDTDNHRIRFISRLVNHPHRIASWEEVEP